MEQRLAALGRDGLCWKPLHHLGQETPAATKPSKITQPLTSPSSTLCLASAHTHVTVLQRLVLLRHLQEDLLQRGVHQPKTGEVQLFQALLQVLWERSAA